MSAATLTLPRIRGREWEGVPLPHTRMPHGG
jgi:hypothetical protein